VSGEATGFGCIDSTTATGGTDAAKIKQEKGRKGVIVVLDVSLRDRKR
jgi:hypothetical protein